MVKNYSVNYTVTPLNTEAQGFSGVPIQQDYTGEKFFGGLGSAVELNIDYWTLRAHSERLFTENIYARGLINRLITNEINTGLTPESLPESEILGISSDVMSPWTELIEARFGLWWKSPAVCDYYGESTFGELQQIARREALISGDVLVVLRQDAKLKIPQVQLINGSRVQTPYTQDTANKNIRHGIEKNSYGRIVAYWVRQDDGVTFSRIPAYGGNSGRRIAWLVFGLDRRLDGERGMPLLSAVLQSLKEIDRYRDAATRKAVVNSILAMFIKKTSDRPSTLPMQNGAVRKGTVPSNGNPTSRNFDITKHIPGVVAQELAVGEEPVGFHSQGTDVNFPEFERAIVAAIAWSNNVPPEILTLAFSNNYSASQAAINEFKIHLNKVWTTWGEAFCTPIYIEWLVSEALQNKFDSTQFLQAWRDPNKFDQFAAWVRVDWFGSIKPSTDMLKQARGSQVAVQYGWTTHSREARTLTGTNFSQNIKWLTKEREKIAQSYRPMLDLQKEYGIPLETIQAMFGVTFEAAPPQLEINNDA